MFLKSTLYIVFLLLGASVWLIEAETTYDPITDSCNQKYRGDRNGNKACIEKAMLNYHPNLIEQSTKRYKNEMQQLFKELEEFDKDGTPASLCLPDSIVTRAIGDNRERDLSALDLWQIENYHAELSGLVHTLGRGKLLDSLLLIQPPACALLDTCNVNGFDQESIIMGSMPSWSLCNIHFAYFDNLLWISERKYCANTIQRFFEIIKTDNALSAVNLVVQIYRDSTLSGLKKVKAMCDQIEMLPASVLENIFGVRYIKNQIFKYWLYYEMAVFFDRNHIDNMGISEREILRNSLIVYLKYVKNEGPTDFFYSDAKKALQYIQEMK